MGIRLKPIVYYKSNCMSCPFEFKTLMHGNEDLSYKDNYHMFDAGHKYLDIYQTILLMPYSVLVPPASVV